jgi:hypothetical protein
MKRIAASIAFGTILWAVSAKAQGPGTAYEARYQITGYLIRAASVCNASKQQADMAFSLLSSHEMKAFSKAFPQTIDQWMARGARMFNSEVMQYGLQKACDHALEVLKKVAQ